MTVTPVSPRWQTARIRDVGTADLDRTLFFTLDIDWAHDHVLEFCHDLFARDGVRATFFATHETPILDRLRSNPLFEVGLHPNFNFLLTGDGRYGRTYSAVIEHYRRIAPDAVSVRSHSLVQGSQIIDGFARAGFRFDSNLFIPWHSGTELRLVEHADRSVVRVPYCWEDDTHIAHGDPWDVDALLGHPGLKVFDFHPIHVYLNTEVLSRYDAARAVLQRPSELQRHVNTSTYGVRNFLEDLIARLK